MKVFINRSCLCYPCWSAKCECGAWLTKHAFTEEDARAEAEDALTRTDRWRHECDRAQLTLGGTVS